MLDRDTRNGTDLLLRSVWSGPGSTNQALDKR